MTEGESHPVVSRLPKVRNRKDIRLLNCLLMIILMILAAYSSVIFRLSTKRLDVRREAPWSMLAFSTKAAFPWNDVS